MILSASSQQNFSQTQAWLHHENPSITNCSVWRISQKWITAWRRKVYCVCFIIGVRYNELLFSWMTMCQQGGRSRLRLIGWTWVQCVLILSGRWWWDKMPWMLKLNITSLTSILVNNFHQSKSQNLVTPGDAWWHVTKMVTPDETWQQPIRELYTLYAFIWPLYTYCYHIRLIDRL